MESMNTDTIKKIYASLKKPIENKLNRRINKILGHTPIKYNNIYPISINRKLILDTGLLKTTRWLDMCGEYPMYLYEEEGMLFLNLICVKILREHCNIEPVFRFGFNNHLCYDITITDFLLFFRMLK